MYKNWQKKLERKKAKSIIKEAKKYCSSSFSFFISIIVVAFSINGFTKLYTKSWCMQDICLCFFYILTQLSYVVSLSRKNKIGYELWQISARSEWPVFASLYIFTFDFHFTAFFFFNPRPYEWQRICTQKTAYIHIFFFCSISKWKMNSAFIIIVLHIHFSVLFPIYSKYYWPTDECNEQNEFQHLFFFLFINALYFFYELQYFFFFQRDYRVSEREKQNEEGKKYRTFNFNILCRTRETKKC